MHALIPRSRLISRALLGFFWVGLFFASNPGMVLGETPAPPALLPAPPKTEPASNELFTTSPETVGMGDFLIFLPFINQPAGASIPYLDQQNRSSIQAYYLENYVNAPKPALGWSGNIDLCVPGTLSLDFQNAVLQRINFFRRMAGVPDDITFEPAFNERAQAAALIMSANKAVTHGIDEKWACYSEPGYLGAMNSNLIFGAYGYAAIDYYMMDPGGNNAAAGHRRWILYPQTQNMGSGDIPPQPGSHPVNALYVFDGHYWDTRPTTRDSFVAWPPRGYVPYKIVYPRWSFSLPDAFFWDTTVTMIRDGQQVPVDIEPVDYRYGENTLVWIPEGHDSWDLWPKPVSDVRYTIHVDNVWVAGQYRSYIYDVIVIDPEN